MTVRGPWYMSARAVREWAALAGLEVDLETDAGWAAAEADLLVACKQAHHVRNQANGLQLWRGPRPLRARLLVSTERREEGELPQLVTVLPGHDGGGQLRRRDDG